MKILPRAESAKNPVTGTMKVAEDIFSLPKYDKEKKIYVDTNKNELNESTYLKELIADISTKAYKKEYLPIVSAGLDQGGCQFSERTIVKYLSLKLMSSTDRDAPPPTLEIPSKLSSFCWLPIDTAKDKETIMSQASKADRKNLDKPINAVYWSFSELLSKHIQELYRENGDCEILLTELAAIFLRNRRGASLSPSQQNLFDRVRQTGVSITNDPDYEALVRRSLEQSVYENVRKQTEKRVETPLWMSTKNEKGRVQTDVIALTGWQLLHIEEAKKSEALTHRAAKGEHPFSFVMTNNRLSRFSDDMTLKQIMSQFKTSDLQQQLFVEESGELVRLRHRQSNLSREQQMETIWYEIGQTCRKAIWKKVNKQEGSDKVYSNKLKTVLSAIGSRDGERRARYVTEKMMKIYGINKIFDIADADQLLEMCDRGKQEFILGLLVVSKSKSKAVDLDQRTEEDQVAISE